MTVNDAQFYQAAIVGFETQKQQIDARIAECRLALGTPAKPGKPAATSESAAKPKRKMSAAARKRIATAQKKRWADYHKNQNSKVMTA